MSEPRGNWYLLTGLLIGLGIGLLIAWFLLPVQYADMTPAMLGPGAQDEYRRTLALAYQATGALARARERLRLLNPNDAPQALAAQAQRMLAENRPPQEARALAVLAADLSKPAGAAVAAAEQTATGDATGNPAEESPAAATVTASATPSPTESMPVETATAEETSALEAVQTATPVLPTRTPTPTFTPRPTNTPRPSATPIRGLDAPFTLKSQQEICDGYILPGLLQVYVYGPDGAPLPGVRVAVSWAGGEEVFYTGLVPEISPGYADFRMDEDKSYNLRVGEASQPVNDLAAPDCGGGLRIELQAEN